MGGASNDAGNCIAIDPDGNVYVTGSFSGTADFSPGEGTNNLISSGGNDIFVVKLQQSTYTYINGLSFGTDINGDIWNIWSADGSDIWDWHSNYVGGYLHYAFKV